jgi:heptosyltransferase-3
MKKNFMFKILITSLRYLVDVITTLPITTLIKEYWPESEIYYLVNHTANSLVANNKLVNKVYIIKNKNLFHKFNLIKCLKLENYDLSFDYSENNLGALLNFGSNAKIRIGYRTKKYHYLRHLCYHKLLDSRIMVMNRHISTCHAEAFNLLGLFPQKIPLPRLYYPTTAKLEVLDFLKHLKIEPDQRYVVLQLASSDTERNWTVKNSLEALDWLSSNIGPCLPIYSNHPVEKKFMAEIMAGVYNFKGRVVDFGGQMPLDNLLALVAGACLFMGVDSFGGHLAAALETPTISLFGPSSNIHWQPRGPKVKVVHSDTCFKRPCRPPSLGGCLSGVSKCFVDLRFESRVRKAVESLLK